jgi:hypothetical protein
VGQFDCQEQLLTGSAGGGVPGGAAPLGCSSRPQRSVARNPAICLSIPFALRAHCGRAARAPSKEVVQTFKLTHYQVLRFQTLVQL